MANLLVGNRFNVAEDNNYLIGGNLCNAFALGELGSHDDFFLIGAEPEIESNYPLLTGNILDSEGKLLFRLVQNTLLINPGHCKKILGNHIGYEIHDSSDTLIFKVSTEFQHLPNSTEECFVTTISGNFFNKDRALVFKANFGGEFERIESSVKSFFGFPGGFVQGYSEDELKRVQLALQTKGAIHRMISGAHSEETVILDGALITDAQIDNCEVRVKTGEFLLGNNIQFTNSRFLFDNPASQIRNLVLLLENQQTDPPSSPEQ